MNKIGIEGMEFYAYHGYYQEEQVLGGKYTVDVYLEVNFSAAAEKDDLSQTINYETIYQIARQQMEVKSKLIEQVCQRIASSIRSAFPAITKLKVRVSKHQPPIKGKADRVFVEIDL